jgi:hypothetical protein
MHFAKSALSLALASTARAFSPLARGASHRVVLGGGAVGSSSRGGGITPISSPYSSTTALGANVLKLTQPAKDLLPEVDVFIFDCDGVIWRVRSIIGAVRLFHGSMHGTDLGQDQRREKEKTDLRLKLASSDYFFVLP